MNDMAGTITPRSDQLNADDLIAGPRTITIREVKITPDTEQPVAVFFDGDGDKPYLPGKSMRRAMVFAWGADASVYAGRSMTLYRDAKVTWGGMEVGGIRISHMSHIDNAMTFVLTATKKTKKPFTVKPLLAQSKPVEPVSTAPPREYPAETGEIKPVVTAVERARAGADRLLARIAACETVDDLHDIAGDPVTSKGRDVLKRILPAADEEISAALTVRFAALATINNAEVTP